MKKFIKRIVLFACLCLLGATLAGCGRKGNCEMCGQYEKLNKFVHRNGEVHWYCNTCYNMMKFFD